MKSGLRELVAGGGAALFLVGLVLGGAFELLPALGLAAVVYLALRLLLPRSTEPAEVAEGVSRDDFERTIREVLETAGRFEAQALEIGDSKVATDTEQIGKIVRDLVKHFERDPASLHRSEDFLSLHLPKALGIVERYAWLARQPYLDERARRELDASQETIAMIEQAFEVQHRKLLADDLREFNIDRRVFEELLQLDPQVEESIRRGKEKEFE
jgi:hypothetical protein